MDIGVEMVDESPRRSGAYKSVASNPEQIGGISRASQIQRQNRCFAISMACFLFFVIIFVIGSNYTRPSDAVLEGPTMNDVNKAEDSGIPSYVIDWLNATVELKDGVKFDIIQTIQHDPAAFTEGLTYVDGIMYESTGMNGQSSVRTVDPNTGQVIRSRPLPTQYFAEGLTYVNGRLIQLTYRKKIGFIYKADDLSLEGNFTFQTTTGEGWGLTYHPEKQQLIVSDGSEYLMFWDPDTFSEVSRLKVIRQNGASARDINELEFWRGRVVANVWLTNVVLVINPENGIVEKEYDFSSLFPHPNRQADVLNGISVSEDPDLLFFTGKYWNKMFLVRLGY